MVNKSRGMESATEMLIQVKEVLFGEKNVYRHRK